MKLLKVIMSGFKSFPERTVVELRGALSVIIGPNGCGKSNIVDAICWVIGESSAKHLRVEAMSEVIFSGTSQRKPLSQASIELIFDNSDASMGGKYAAYSEIAVRRILQRDGQSQYFFNRTACRRRDILDLILGTGLGPRSYAISEQGMVAKLVDAKPEALGVYFKEAAGISKYQERRRETALSMERTRLNLARLQDIQDELEKQLMHAKRQRSAAERFKKLKSIQKQLRLTEAGLQLRDFMAKAQEQGRKVGEQQVLLAEQQAKQQGIDTQIQRLGVDQAAQRDALHAVQDRYYRLGAEVTQSEYQLQQMRDTVARCESENLGLKAEQEKAQAESVMLENKSSHVAQEITTLEEAVVAYDRRSSVDSEALSCSEAQMQEWQRRWEAYLQRSSGSTAQLDRLRSEYASIEKHQSALAERLEGMCAEHHSLDIAESERGIAEQRDRVAVLEQAEQQAHTTLEELRRKIITLRSQRTEHDQKTAALRTQLQKSKAQHAALEVIQKGTLGDRSPLRAWLQARGINDTNYLAQGIEVAGGWELAVEVVLRDYLEAVNLTGHQSILADIAALPPGNFAAMWSAKEGSKDLKRAKDKPMLLDKVSTDWPILSRLASVYIADTFEEALRWHASLAPGESVVTKTGIWLGPSWIRVLDQRDAGRGIIEREQALAALIQSIAETSQHLEIQEAEHKSCENALTALETQQTQAQQAYTEATRCHQEALSTLHSFTSRLSYQQQRHRDLAAAITTLQQEQESLGVRYAQVQDQRDQAEAQESIFSAEKTELLEQKNQYQQTLINLHKQIDGVRSAKAHAVLQLQRAQQDRRFLQESAERERHKVRELCARSAALVQEKEQVLQPCSALEATLDARLLERSSAEQAVVKAKERVASLEAGMQELSDQRRQIENAIERLRQKTEALRLEQQSMQVQSDMQEERIVALGGVVKTVLSELSEEATLAHCKEELAGVSARIERLGPINLAAEEEYQQCVERQTYLQSQRDDLEEALVTLTRAIQKIDTETTAQFTAAYEHVSTAFSALFARMFEGGRAELALLDSDINQVKVSIMAQPPGKRNASIHALSGGEKALTAIALIFAFFQLNPAPFCILDEVDAPLDDANVLRFCRLLKEIAQSVQCIVVTHNKLAMEVADDLIGVTMKEPGVSCLVSVEVDKTMMAVKNNV